MTRTCQLALGLALAVLTATTAPGQEKKRGGFRGAGGFGGGQLMLLSQKSVQEELKLSEEQIEKVALLSKKSLEGLKDLKDLSKEDRRKKFTETTAANAKALGEILKKEQGKRLKEISLQTRGGSALADPEVASALKLTDEQKEKIKSIREESRGKGKGGFSPEARKAAQEKLLGVLNDEQKTAWKTLTGEPFKGEIQTFKGKGRKKSDASPRKKKVLEVSFLAQEGDKEKKPAAKDKDKGKGKGPKGFGKGPWGPGKGPWAGKDKGKGKGPWAKGPGKGSKRFAWSGKKGGRHMAFGPRHHRGHRAWMGRHGGHRHGWAGRSGRSMGSRYGQRGHRHGWAGRGHGKRSPSARGWGGHRHGPRAGYGSMGRGYGSRPGSSAFARGPSRPPVAPSRFGGSRGRSGDSSSDIRGDLERIERMLSELQRKLRR